MGPNYRVPLFITRFSLSPRTSPGVQTSRLLRAHPDWLHFHWSSGTLKELDSRSVMLENRLIGRYSFLQSPRSVRLEERLGIGSWTGYQLRSKVADRLVAKYRHRVSSVYLAPLSEGDARRCLNLAHLIGAPFVLHLWDVLEGDVQQGALRELIERAETVFCVSKPLLHDVAAMREDAALLLFSRDASLFQATPWQQGPFKVVVHGNISSYADGLDVLHEAIALLEKQGLPVEVYFPGSPKILRQSRTTLKSRIKLRGFFATQEALDRELSKAHVAFLPGPRQDPRDDLRSRYSIPSRIMDYLATGLPIVGTIHSASATGTFLESLSLDGATTCTSAAELAGFLKRLTTSGDWATESARSRHGFCLLQNQEAPATTLQRAMARIRTRPLVSTNASPARFLPLAVQKNG